MLNDVLSLCVGLWAVRIANKESSKMYTYGWQRAETLGALINGVFLVALCLSIFLQAIERFVEPQEVSNPKLVLIVGCLGLGSNILGLFLFHDHDHGHSHGGDKGHSHAKDSVKNAEEGNGHVHSHGNASHVDAQTRAIGDESGNIADVLPQAIIAGYKKSDEENTAITGRPPTTPTRKPIPSSGEIHARHRRRTSGSFGRGFGSVDNIHVHPASFRHDIIKAARLEEQSESDTEEEALLDEEGESSVISHVKGSPQQQPQARVSGYGSISKRKSL